MLHRSKVIFACLFVSSLFTPAKAANTLGLNAGLSVSKSILGISYTSGRNEINAGLKGFAFALSGDYAVQPGLTYNRYLTETGWYGSLGYAPVYHNEDGWGSGDVFLGGGKNFQFTSWGVNLDGGLSSPANGDFARSTGFWLGAGASYRFRLD